MQAVKRALWLLVLINAAQLPATLDWLFWRNLYTPFSVVVMSAVSIASIPVLAFIAWRLK